MTIDDQSAQRHDPLLEFALMPLASKLRTVTGRIWRQMRRDITAFVLPDMTPVRLGVLANLERRGALTIGSLAEAEQMAPSTMTRVVDALEVRKLVTRRPDRGDRRSVVIALTAAGRRALRNGRDREDALMAQALARITSEERDVVSRALEILMRLTEEP